MISNWAAWKSSLWVLSLAVRCLSSGFHVAFWVDFCFSHSFPSCPMLVEQFLPQQKAKNQTNKGEGVGDKALE